MGSGSGFPIDLILFGMIAAFLVLRLRSILGRRTGFERQAPPYSPPPNQAGAGPVAAVVIGRHINREWHENDRRLRAIGRPFDWGRCALCAAAGS